MLPCYTATSYYPVIGGAQLYLHEVARRFAADGPVRAVAFWEQHRTDWLLGTTVRAPGRSWQRRVDGVDVRGIGLDGAGRRRLALPALLFYGLKSWAIHRAVEVLAPEIDRRVQGDLLHNSRIGREPFSFASLQVARRRGIPFVFTPNHHPRWVGWNYRRYLELYRRADVLVVYTEAERRFLREELGVDDRRIFVTGIGPVLAPRADPGAWRARHGVEGPLVLYLGQKFRYKNFHVLLEAAQRVWERHPEVCFAFVGPRTPFSRQVFRETPDDRRVLELDRVSLEDKTAALAACDVLCLPSAQESFGMVIVEAWSQSRPVVVAPSPAVGTLVEDGVDGLVVEPTAAALGAALERLVASPHEAEELGARGREKLERRYTWDRVTGVVREAYAAAAELPAAS